MFSGNKLVIKINKDSRLRIEDIAFIFFFSGNAIIYFVDQIFKMIGLSSLNSLGLIIVNSITLIGIIIGLFRTERKTFYNCIGLFFLIGILIFTNYLLQPEIGSWLTDDSYGLNKLFGLNGHIFSGGMIAFYVMIIQRDPDRIFKNLKVSNIILIAYLLLVTYFRFRKGYFLVEGANGIRQSVYNMAVGYYCAFVGIFNYIIWLNEKKRIYCIIGIIFAFLGIVLGSRGVVVSYALFVICIVLTSLHKAKLAKKLLIILLIVIVTITLVTYYTEIALGIQYFLSSLGISNSRTVSLLNTSDFLDANGRDLLWPLGISMIKEKFPFGYGFMGERPIIGNYVRWGYVHNVFLEIIIEFGLIGFFISLLLIINSAKYVNNSSDPKWNSLFILFFSNCGMLLISNSFWYFPYFWAAIATGIIYGKTIIKNRDSI